MLCRVSVNGSLNTTAGIEGGVIAESDTAGVPGGAIEGVNSNINVDDGILSWPFLLTTALLLCCSCCCAFFIAALMRRRRREQDAKEVPSCAKGGVRHA